MALRTPDRVFNCLRPLRSPRANARSLTPDQGKKPIPGVCSSHQHRVFPYRLRLITTWSLVPLRHNQLENALARPISSPPLRRRVYLARWSQIIHHYPPFLGRRLPNSYVGPPQFPVMWATVYFYAARKTCQC